MLITRIDGMVSYAFGRCRLSKTRAPTAYPLKRKGERAKGKVQRANGKAQRQRIKPARHSHMMLIPRNEPTSDHARSEYRLLYVGRDADWFRRLKSALGLPANRLVYCPGHSVEYFLKRDIRY